MAEVFPVTRQLVNFVWRFIKYSNELAPRFGSLGIEDILAPIHLNTLRMAKWTYSHPK